MWSITTSTHATPGASIPCQNERVPTSTDVSSSMKPRVSAGSPARWRAQSSALVSGHGTGVVMPSITPSPATYQLLATSGVKVVRGFMQMSDVEPAPGQFNQAWLNEYDAWIARLNAMGIKID